MKTKFCSVLLSSVVLLTACTPASLQEVERQVPDDVVLSRQEIARLLSELPLGNAQYNEVYDAVNSSSGNGYDEEYMMSDLLTSPGAGVGDRHSGTRAATYSTPIKDMIADYLEERYSTKAGAADVEAYLKTLSESDLQIYWPYSEDWDGSQPPVITFDPGYGAESNYGYVIGKGPDGMRVVDSLVVTEEVAMSRPVWVINSNDDSAFTPFDLYSGARTKAEKEPKKTLVIKDFKALRNYDSWFGGASEFFIKVGAADGFKASKEEDLRNYSPSVTDFVIVVKRKDVGTVVPFDALLLTDFTSQIEKLAFMIVEDDGGTTTNWKCSATVKYQSRTYGFDLDIPYKDKDDIVWRGQLDASFFDKEGEITGRFGDVAVTFEKL